MPKHDLVETCLKHIKKCLRGSKCAQINIHRRPSGHQKPSSPFRFNNNILLTLFLILFPRPSSSTTGAGTGGDTGAGAGAETGGETAGAETGAIPEAATAAIEVVTAVAGASAVLGTVSVAMGSVVAVSEGDNSATGETGPTYAEASSIVVVAATGALLACMGGAGTKASSALRFPYTMVQATNIQA